MKRLRPEPIVVAAVLIVALGATGCGSSSKKSSSAPAATTTAPAITKAEFVAKANAICTAGNKLTNAAGAQLGRSPNKAKAVAVVKNAFVPAIQAQISRIRALGAPAADKATVTKMLDLAQADLDKVKSKPSLLASNANPFGNFARIAHPYGLKACARKS
jgi:hypothetical protein